MKNSSVLSSLKAVLRNNKGYAFALCLTAVMSVLLALIPPQIIRIIIDKYLMVNRTSSLAFPAIIYLVVIIMIGAADFLQAYLLTYFGQRMIHVLRGNMMDKLHRLPSAYFTENSVGSITSRIMTDVESIDDLFSDGLVSMAVDSLTLIGIIVSIWIFSYRLALIALCLIPIIFVITRFFKRRMYKAQTENLEELGHVNGHIAESVKNIMMIKLFSKERYMEEKYCRKLEKNYRTNGKVIIYDSCYAPIIQLIRALVIASVVILSADQIGVTGFSVGMIAATIDLISALLSPVESLGMEIQSIQSGLSGMKRIDGFLALAEEKKDDSISAKAISEGIRKQPVSFENLSFSYDGRFPVLNNISMEILLNESVTFAGRTGVGKSTLFGLVLGLIRPTSGYVTVGGYPSDRIPNSLKRNVFGYVEQNFRFIPGTIAEQISLGDPSISIERIKEVCSDVGLADSIKALPESYETYIVGQGVFSKGQCQLLSIARAVAANPQIILLDEITANLDSATEERIMSAIKNVSYGRTVLSISHRESAMRNCDRLIFIENGIISLQGKPEDVLD